MKLVFSCIVALRDLRTSVEINLELVVSGCMAPHSSGNISTLAWKIPWMEEPGRLQSIGSRRVGHD